MLVGFYLSGAIYAFGLKRMLKSRPATAGAAAADADADPVAADAVAGDDE